MHEILQKLTKITYQSQLKIGDSHFLAQDFRLVIFGSSDAVSLTLYSSLELLTLKLFFCEIDIAVRVLKINLNDLKS